ncbi:hypothetical protein C7S15_1015 [Burkholderia cepacia]|nr:hypothetical protein [Burkholderia cepacia]
MPAARRRGINSESTFLTNRISVMSAKFYFYFFGISDRWRIERVDGA